MKKGKLRDLIRIERPVVDRSFKGAGFGGWQKVDDVWAEVQDVLPSRGEKLSDGLNIAARPARVRMLPRSDVSSSMRFVMGDRIMQIVSGPALIENRSGMEFMVEDFSTAGNAA